MGILYATASPWKECFDCCLCLCTEQQIRVFFSATCSHIEATLLFPGEQLSSARGSLVFPKSHILAENLQHALSVCQWWKLLCLFTVATLPINLKHHYLLLDEDKLFWQAWPQFRGCCVQADSDKWPDIENSWKCCTAVFSVSVFIFSNCTYLLEFLPSSVLVSCGMPETGLPCLPERAYCKVTKKPFRTQHTVSCWKSGVLWKNLFWTDRSENAITKVFCYPTMMWACEQMLSCSTSQCFLVKTHLNFLLPCYLEDKSTAEISNTIQWKIT